MAGLEAAGTVVVEKRLGELELLWRGCLELEPLCSEVELEGLMLVGCSVADLIPGHYFVVGSVQSVTKFQLRPHCYGPHRHLGFVAVV